MHWYPPEFLYFWWSPPRSISELRTAECVEIWLFPGERWILYIYDWAWYLYELLEAGQRIQRHHERYMSTLTRWHLIQIHVLIGTAGYLYGYDLEWDGQLLIERFDSVTKRAGCSVGSTMLVLVDEVMFFWMSMFIFRDRISFWFVNWQDLAVATYQCEDKSTGFTGLVHLAAAEEQVADDQRCPFLVSEPLECLTNGQCKDEEICFEGACVGVPWSSTWSRLNMIYYQSCNLQ